MKFPSMGASEPTGMRRHKRTPEGDECWMHRCKPRVQTTSPVGPVGRGGSASKDAIRVRGYGLSEHSSPSPRLLRRAIARHSNPTSPPTLVQPWG